VHLKDYQKIKHTLLVNYALDLGINKFDTGVNYGNWRTQPLLGLVLQEHIQRDREKLIITSKAGTQQNGSENFTPDYIEHKVNNSSLKDSIIFDKLSINI